MVRLVYRLKASRRCQYAHGCLAAATALALLALLAVAAAPSAVADDGDPGSRVVAVTRPYWKATLPGYIRDLAVGDLNGDNQLEIVVGQGVESGGWVSVIGLGEDVLSSLQFTTPVSAVALENVDEDACAELFVAQGADVLALNVPELQGPGNCKGAAGNQEMIRWTRHLTLTSPEQSVSKLMMIDVDGDGTSEVVAIAGDVFALKADDGAVLPESWSLKNEDTGKPDAVKWLAVIDHGEGAPPQIRFGTQSGAIYDREGHPVAGQFCDGDLFESLNVGNWDDDTSLKVVAGCKKTSAIESYLEVRDLDGGLVLSYSRPSAVVEPVIAPEGHQSVFFRHATGASILRPLSITPTAGAGFEEISFFSDGLPTDAVFTDLNGDGKNEVVIGAQDTVRLFGYDKNRDPELGLFQVFSSLAPAQLSAPAFGELNEDYVPDVVVGSGEGFVYSNRASRQQTLEFVAREPIGAVRLVDLDRDGLDDILALSNTGVFARSVQPWDVSWQKPITGTVSDLSVANLDNDGTPEVLVGSRLPDSYLVWAISADGTLYWSEPISYTNTSEAYTTLIAEDLTGDGRLVLLIVAGDNLYVTDITGHTPGRVLWQQPFTDPIKTVVLADLDASRGVIVATENMIHALLGKSGKLLWQAEIPDLRSIAAADVNGDGRLEVIAGSKGGSIYVLNSQHQPQAILIPGQAEIKRLVGADLVSETPGQELLVITGDRKLSLVQVTGEQGVVLCEFSLPGEITSMSLANLEGEGREEVTVTTSDGRLLLFGWTLKQPALWANLEYPVVHEPNAAEEYSVDVFDPDNELAPEGNLDLRLEIPNPGTNPFQKAEREDPTRFEPVVPGPTHFVWNISAPFEEWDAGHEVQVRVVYSNGKVAPQSDLPEIRVSGLKPEYKYGGGVLLGAGVMAIGAVVLVRRRQRWSKSPAGEASRLYKRIEASPENLLVEIAEVVAHPVSAPDILAELHVQCGRKRSTCAAGMAEVVQGYALLLGGAKQWEAGLDSLQSGLNALPEVDGKAETLAVCRLLDATSAANSVARIVALRSQIDAVRAMDGVSIPWLSDIQRVLGSWAEIVDTLKSYQENSNTEEKVRYLGHALTSLNHADREARNTLDEPLRTIHGEFIVRWSDTVNNALDELRGRAFLQISMPTHRVIALDDVVVALTLRNEGSAEAQNVNVELLQSQQYEILEGDGKVARAIPAAQSKSIEFRVRPLVESSFLAKFRISYDDQRRTGRSIEYADQVALVQVTEAYRPIPNPYHAGRPLPTGSPLFFGRDDVFAFIAGKLGGPSLDNVLILIGQRRCGKTSLLKQLPDKMEKRYVPVYIDGQQLGIDPGMANLFYGLSQVIASSLTAAGVEVAAPPRENFEPAPSQVFEQEFLARAEAALGERRLLLAFDEFEEIEARVRDGNVDRAVFPFLRHLMQHSTKVAFMFVGTHKLEELTKDYWSVFFNIAHHKEIRFLDEKAASRLIREPVAAYGLVYDDLAVKRVLEITAGHPYFVQLMCLALVDCANVSKRNFITVEDVRTVVDQTIALGEAHFRWLWDQSGPKEQLVLATLTELLRDEALVTSSAIASRLATPGMSQGWRMDPAEVSDILSRLAGQDVVEEISDHVLQYRFKLEIVNLWIRRNRPLSRVIEDVTVREPFRATEPTTDAGS